MENSGQEVVLKDVLKEEGKQKQRGAVAQGGYLEIVSNGAINIRDDQEGKTQGPLISAVWRDIVG